MSVRRYVLTCLIPAISSLCFAQTKPPAPYGALPSARQLRWSEMEMYCLIHFGANTYLDHEWGYGDEDPNLIDPVDFNPLQIVGAVKAGGFKGIVVVAKHHDGLCLWPTKTTTHNISQSRWRNGKGDFVKAYEEACNTLGLRLGVYCSPWDRNNPAYGTPAYLAIYRAQLKELYSHYGPLFMSWHDGANGGDGFYGGAKERRNIDRTVYYDWDSTWNITRHMQPGAVIFGDVGPDVRWVGNEQGHAAETSWATFTPEAPDPGRKAANGYSKAEIAPGGTRNGEFWMPAECDVPLRPGWFYHASQDLQVKTPAQLLDLYYASVGRGADLDLGIAPNKKGLLDEHDVHSLKAFGDLLRHTFAVNFAAQARLKASNVRGNDYTHYGPRFLLDADRYTYWATDDSITTPWLELNLAARSTFNVIRLRENIKLGQRIDSVAVDVWVDDAGHDGSGAAAGHWAQIASATSIGPNRLIRLGHNITASLVRLRITGSPVCIALSDFGLYREQLQQPPPVIRRESSGMVSIVPEGAARPIHYTLDGATPGLSSPLYTQPFLLAQGGTVKARSIDREVAGDIQTQVFGISHSGWSVVSATPQGGKPESAIDEDESSAWNALGGTADITIDMGRQQTIKAFTYLPRRTTGIVDRYAFYTSENGQDWEKVKQGEFSNIAANPLQQLVLLKSPVRARYFRFSALHAIGEKNVSVVELGVVTELHAEYNLIPYPAYVSPGVGSFTITAGTKLVSPDMFKNEAAFLREMIHLPLAGQGNGTIVLGYDKGIALPEGYTLTINPNGVILKASSSAGMFYAIETLRQLLPASIEADGPGNASVPAFAPKALTLPAVKIEDHPALAWRGMMLDVSRHFFSVDYVKRFIDRMALYKLNTLHLHLTDDQGWRIEIKKYPRLAEESGWRTFNSQDSACMQLAAETGNPDFNIDSTHLRYRDGKTEYGGYYTQEQLKDIIRYAASRHIEIVPEIDMPGHMMAATALYPWLTCNDNQGADGSQGFSNPICPCKDSAVQFAKDVLSEVIALFPSKYIHIGGDEVEKRDWERSTLVHDFMARHQIKTLDQLQSHFNDELQAFFKAHGKTLVGWDEIVDGGMDASAVVMYWRTWAKQAPLKATRNGNKVVMTPDGPFYFDAWPDRNALDVVYHYDPTDPRYGMSPAEQQNIIGVQANLWTERVPTEQRADYLTMPRMTALAELGWTRRDLYDTYTQRLNAQYGRMDLLGIHYRLPDLPEMADSRVFIDTASFFVSSPLPGLTVRYTTDGSNPTAASPALTEPLSIDHSMTLKVAAFAGARSGDVNALTFERQAYAPALEEAKVVPGLACHFYKGMFRRTTQIGPQPDTTLAVSRVAVPSGITDPEFGLKFDGFIDVPETGIYSFFLTSNDGSVLRIADRLVVDNDGLHGDKEKSGQVALSKGLHAFALDFMEAGGGYTLKLAYSKDNGQPREVPQEWFKKKD